MIRHASPVAAVLLALTACDGEEVSPTWSDDVAPLVERKCAGCHREGGIAPFALETFDDAAPRAEMLARAVESGLMPPFPPDTSGDCLEIDDWRQLTDEERRVFREWADLGAPAGDASHTLSLTWEGTLPDADVEVGPDAPYEPRGEDDYRCFVLDPALAEDRYVTAFEARPGEPRIVHHVVLFAVPDDEVEDVIRGLDGSDPGPGYTCFGDAGHPGALVVGAWAPGGTARELPEGTGIRLSAGRPVVMQVHYHPTDEPLSDRTTFALRTARDVAQPARTVMLYDTSLVIPPRTEGYEVTPTFVFHALDRPVELLAAFPHMHELGRSIRLVLERADDTEQCLISIPSWDFEWQDSYFFREPATIDPGDAVSVRCVYDNPGDEHVTWGTGTADEMCFAVLYLTGLE